MAMEFWWWPVSAWLSPGAAWFIFFNAVVGAIAVMSRGQGDARASSLTTRHKLARTASTVVMESLRSISIFSFHSGVVDYGVVSPPPVPQLHQFQDPCFTFQEQEADEVSRVAPVLRLCKLEPAPVSRDIGMAPATAPPSAPVATAAAAADSLPSASEREEEEAESISLDEAYTLARAQRQSPASTAAAAAAAAAETVARGPRKREPVKVAEVKRRAHACGRGAEEVEAKAEVNARAERFIRQFREELKLERLNSILSHSHAVRRGAGSR